MSWFNLALENGQTEELEPEDTREWFRLHGANMEVVEKALDYVWNFGTYRPITITIQNYREIRALPSRVTPDI